MNWSTGQQTQKPLSAETTAALSQFNGDKQMILAAWQGVSKELEAVRIREMILRKAAVELYFPSASEGINRTELGGGWSLKTEVKFNYGLANKNKETEKAIDELCAISQQAAFIADRLITWKPDISIKEYRLLNPDNLQAQTEEQRKILTVLAPILTIKPGAPTLELEPPKKAA